MLKKYMIALLFIIMVMLAGSNVLAYEGLPSEVKIGLYYSSSALYTPKISCDGYVTVKNNGEEVAWGKNLTIKRENGVTNIYNDEGHIYSHTGSNDLTYHATEKGFIKINGKPYRGFLITKLNSNGAFTIINQVDLEQYLYGVVPRELSTTHPIEALKAQTVCARTYASRNIGSYSKYGFDMTNGQSSQAYGGVSVEAADCTQAVEETRGQVILYTGKPAETFYFSTSSGVTLNCKDVWFADLPYLTSVEDTYQHLVVPDKKAWSLTVTAARFKQILANNGVNIGDITDVQAEHNEQGAVMKLTFVGTSGTKSYTKETTRNLLGLNSQVYTITANRPNSVEKRPFFAMTQTGVMSVSGKVNIISDYSTAESSSFVAITANGTQNIESEVAVTNVTSELSFTLKGSGWGHGVGMSQNGAIGMAKAGFNYKDILKHYFRGTTIG